MKRIDIVPFPSGAESNGFVAALSSALLPCLGIDARTPYWCNPKGSHCIRCSECNLLHRHQEMLYHALLAVSGLAFGFDYPEDDDVDFHTLPGVPIGWRWQEPFVAELMDFAGLSYERCAGKSVTRMYDAVKGAIDAGYTALAANHSAPWQGENAWTRCWRVVCGYTDKGILVMEMGGQIREETQAVYDDWIVITGRAERKCTYRDVLEKILAVLTHPSHDALEKAVMADLSHVTADNAVSLCYKMLGINGVPIEARWHGAEAFISCDCLLSHLTDNEEVKRRLGEVLFARYIDDSNGSETHGVGWKIWAALDVGPETGYMPTEKSFALIQKPEAQRNLKQLFGIVFDNDRAVAQEIRAVLDEWQA